MLQPFYFGAEKRIRTSGTFQAHTRFPIVLLKPLRHLCINSTLFHKVPIYSTVFLEKRQAFFTAFSKNIKKSYFFKLAPVACRNSYNPPRWAKSRYPYIARTRI